MTLAGLRLQWTETNPLALWPRRELYSEAIYTHLAQRNSMLVFPTKRGGLERWSRERKKKRKERGRHKLKIGEETQRWLPACLSSWAPVESENVFVCMHTCHPVCSASLVNSNYGWMHRKVNNSKREERGVKKQQLYIVREVTHQNTHIMYRQITSISIGYV